MAEKREKLFDQFSPVSPEEWRAKAEVDLKGADFDKKMVWRTNEGFNVQPLYRGVDIKDFKTIDSLPSEYPYVRGTRTNNEWLVRQDIKVTDPKAANAKALDILNKGVTALGFKLCKDAEIDLDTLLDGIYTDVVEINFSSCPCKAIDLAKALVDYLNKKGTADKFKGSIDFNPFGRQLKAGKHLSDEIADKAAELLKIVAPVKGLRVLSVNSDMLCNAGAFIYQELGYALAWGNEWMAMLTDKGFTADEIAHRIKFNMGVSTIYFMEIAKFRAARMLWAQIVKQYGPECDCACKMVVNASTSRFTQTLFDSHVNLLRSQTQAMSAALACVDEITVTPFDAPYSEGDDFSERIARNQQILLMEESHLDKVVDPAGGSYYVEELTMSLAKVAWQLFLEVEDKGGFMALVKNNEIAEAVNASAVNRFDKVAKRKEQLLGTNQFPNFTEVSGDKRAMCCKCGCHEPEEGVVTLNDKRLASGFEELRQATEQAEHTPVVFMLTIGNLAMRLARAQFSDNFFGCAGYKLIDNNGFATVEEGVEAAVAAKADIVVLCSSDLEYPELIPGAIKALDGRAEFVLAGPETDEFKEMGVTNFINVRTNVLSTLKAFNAKLLK
ncbi:MAG: methylmalonyl-CoA mutase small subunit [Muribaculaceae bacterium]|nr:methylmalonyl-CoA mutase small subunit [Muribaculaceae bacterium]